jgi:hypothetical protein
MNPIDASGCGRRNVLAGAGAAALLGGLEGCGTQLLLPRREPSARVEVPALHASTDRITGISVCTRPFRAQGPRIEMERVGEQWIVHNYGHGGSGWSLSWGSSGIAVEKALQTGERRIGVIGCGALGLTSALLLQRAGAEVTIYAREIPPQVRSSMATGVWTPDSRICLQSYATPEFRTSWEAMARQSYQTYQSFLGLAGDPVEFIDSYLVADTPEGKSHSKPESDGRPPFADLKHSLVDDLLTQRAEFAPGSHPFGPRYVARTTMLMFNLSAYCRLLINDFLVDGGRIEITEFHAPADLARLSQKTLIHATGYGARALFGDRSVTPVRGQLARMIPQPDIHYGIFYNNVSFVPRRDGMVFQAVGENDYYGFDDETTVPDRAEAEAAVRTIAGLFT